MEPRHRTTTRPPPGWTESRQTCPSGRVILKLHGPRGMTARSRAEAWRHYDRQDGGEPPRATAPTPAGIDVHAILREERARAELGARHDQGESDGAREMPMQAAELWRHSAEPISWFGQFGAHPRQQKIDQVMARAAMLGLLDPFGEDEELPPGADAARRLEHELLRTERERMARAVEPEGVAYMLTWYAIYLRAMPHRRHWLRPDTPEARRANECTISLVREVIRVHGSIKAGQLGQTLRAGTIGGIIGTLRAFISRMGNCDARAPEGHTRQAAALKDCREQDGPRPLEQDLRIRRQGWRARHFREAVAKDFDYMSEMGCMRWGTLQFCHHAVARAGEAGVTKLDRPFDPRRGIACRLCTCQAPEVGHTLRQAAIEAGHTGWPRGACPWHDVAGAPRGGEVDIHFLGTAQSGTDLPGAIVSVWPIKDTQRWHRKRPLPFSALTAS